MQLVKLTRCIPTPPYTSLSVYSDFVILIITTHSLLLWFSLFNINDWKYKWRPQQLNDINFHYMRVDMKSGSPFYIQYIYLEFFQYFFFASTSLLGPKVYQTVTFMYRYTPTLYWCGQHLSTPLTLLLKHCTIHRVTFSPFLELFSTVTDIKALCYPLYVSQLRDISSLDVWLLIGLQTGGISDRTSPTLTSSAPALHRAAAQSLQYKSATQPAI